MPLAGDQHAVQAFAAGAANPAFRPALGFSRTYDAQVAQQESQTGTPGAMGRSARSRRPPAASGGSP